jgi:hypothetical protein
MTRPALGGSVTRIEVIFWFGESSSGALKFLYNAIYV